jgi:glycosyltransferase involved in cell wall biosynthesis
MNLLYNTIDAVALLSSNEGWGLSLTEAMMCGKPIIANVTGGMQDQMRFEDKNGKWVEFDSKFCSNHFGTYKKHGKWAYPVFPSNMSLQGSVATPYIFDDRADFREAATAIAEVYATKMNDIEKYKDICKAAREWVTSDESGMSANKMCDNIINHVNEVFDTFKPKKSFELIKTEALKRKHIRHQLVY